MPSRHQQHLKQSVIAAGRHLTAQKIADSGMLSVTIAENVATLPQLAVPRRAPTQDHRNNRTTLHDVRRELPREEHTT